MFVGGNNLNGSDVLWSADEIAKQIMPTMRKMQAIFMSEMTDCAQTDVVFTLSICGPLWLTKTLSEIMRSNETF